LSHRRALALRHVGSCGLIGPLYGDQMLLRKWVGLLAMLGVLLHAGAVARHHVVMLDAHLQHQRLVSDLQRICHSNGLGTATDESLPDVPRPSDAQNNCPICCGLTTAVAVMAPDAAPWLVLIAPPSPQSVARVAFVGQSPAIRPPVRGPPALA